MVCASARRIVLPILVFAAGAATAHGEARRAGGLGTVSFQNSCSPQVQEKLVRGVAMLHSFFYSAAERAFEEVAAQDNSCAISALRGFYGAGLAAAQSGEPAKARQHFGRLVEMAGEGEPRPEIAAARRWLAAN